MMKVKILFFMLTLVIAFSCAEDSPNEEEKNSKKENLHEIKKYDGTKYKPEQPIKFSHKNDIPEGMKCEYCHRNSDKMDSVRSAINLPEELNKDYQHKNPVGDVTDCNRCHY